MRVNEWEIHINFMVRVKIELRNEPHAILALSIIKFSFVSLTLDPPYEKQGFPVSNRKPYSG